MDSDEDSELESVDDGFLDDVAGLLGEPAGSNNVPTPSSLLPTAGERRYTEQSICYLCSYAHLCTREPAGSSTVPAPSSLLPTAGESADTCKAESVICLLCTYMRTCKASWEHSADT